MSNSADPDQTTFRTSLTGFTLLAWPLLIIALKHVPFLQKQSSASNSAPSIDSECRISELSGEVQKLQDEKSHLQDRLKKSNEENMNLIEKVRVSVINYYLHYFCGISGIE